MAITKIYESEFSDIRDNDWRIDIFKNPQGTITVKNFVCADPGFTLSYQGADDIFSPLLPSTCTIPFIVENLDDAAFITALFTMFEGEYIVEIQRYTALGYRLHWRGFLTSDNLTIPDTVTPYVVELQAVDGLQTLSRRDHPSTGTHSMSDIMVDALATIPTVGRYSTSDDFLRMGIDMEPQGLPTYNGNPFSEMKIAVTSLDFLTGQPGESPTAEDMLTQIMTLHNSRLFQRDGVWTIQPMSAVLDEAANILFKRVTKIKTAGADGLFTLNENLETGNDRLVGDWSIQFLPPVSRVTRELNYLGNRPICGVAFPGFDVNARINNQTTPGTPPTLSVDLDTQFPAGEKFTFRARITMEQDPVASEASEPLVRYRLQFTVKVGSYYLGRNHELGLDETTVGSSNFNVGNSDQDMRRPKSPGGVYWSTDSATRVQMIGDILNSDLENGFAAGGTDYCDMELSIESPPLPAATDVDCEIVVRSFGFSQGGGSVAAAIADAANIYCDPQLFVGTGSDSDVVKFSASVSNNASEEYAIEPVSLYGESGNADDQFPAIYFGSLVGPGGSLPTGYQSSLTTSTALANQVVCIDRLRHLQTAQQVRNGSAFVDRDITPMNYVTFDSAKWAIVNMQHTAKSCLMRFELVKIAAADGPTSDPFEVQNKTILPPRTLNAAGDSIRREFNTTATSLNDTIADTIAQTDAKIAAVNLDDLADVATGSPNDGDVIRYTSATQTWNRAPVPEPLADADQTIAANRAIDLDGNTLSVVDGSNTKMTVSNTGGVTIFGEFKVDSGTVAGGALRLEEWDTAGQNAVILQAPIILASDVTFTLPGADGTADQVLQTNGSGTLSWGDRVKKLNPVVNNTLTIRPVIQGQPTQIFLKGADDNGGIYLEAPDNISSTPRFTLPATDGTAGQQLTTNGSGVLSFADASPGFSYHVINSAFYTSDGNGDYIPIGGTLSETTSSLYYNIWTAPCDGELIKATALVSNASAGLTYLTARKYPTPASFASANHTFSTAYATGTFTFGAGATFSAGDRLQFFFNPANRPDGVSISILMKLTHI